MIARLSRFYAGTHPMQWIAEFPMGVVRACARLLPRLRAEESVLAAERVQMGTGSFSDASAADAVTRRWQEALEPAGASKRSRPNPHALAAIGIGFRRVKAAPKVADGR